jgi:2-polyprenyl-3-methyl-5-hydroxy-6-metoxy-1,4-benzoquinol methylase
MASMSPSDATLDQLTVDTPRVWYDRGWERETERLRSLEAEFDPGTCRLLEDLGVGDGWRCLEVGAGAGSMARWLARRCAPSGRVVAIDLDLRHMDCAGLGNLETRQQDIVTDDVGEEAFDIIHARAVLEHIPDRLVALRRMVAALKPEGWLLVEAVDAGRAMVSALARYTSREREVGERIMGVFEPLFTAAGADACFGTRLSQALQECGLRDVQGEMRARIVPGGADDFRHLSLQLLKPELVRQGLVSAAEAERLIELTGDPRIVLPPLMLVAVWGRRPLDG